MMWPSGGTQWIDAGGPAFGSCNSEPGQPAINASGLAIVTSQGEDVGVYVQLG